MIEPQSLRSLRRSRTLSQEDMARLLDVSQQTYSKYESGRLVPDIGMKARIAAILGTLPEMLWPADEPAAATK